MSSFPNQNQIKFSKIKLKSETFHFLDFIFFFFFFKLVLHIAMWVFLSNKENLQTFDP